MKHVHAELIKAWADGAAIEVFNGAWVPIAHPSWGDEMVYRIKPQPPIVVEKSFKFDVDRGVVQTLRFTVDPATYEVLAVELVK